MADPRRAPMTPRQELLAMLVLGALIGLGWLWLLLLVTSPELR